jgi:hypothetical protein
MIRAFLLAPAGAALLAGCGPQIDGELIAGRTVMITNREDAPVSITRIVANDAEDNAECVEEPGTPLGPGRTYTTTFFLCDEVREVDIVTDQGTREIDFN